MKVILFSLLFFSLHTFAEEAQSVGANPEEKSLRIKDVYPVGPFVEGRYVPTTTEDDRQAEEEKLQETQAGEDNPLRVNENWP